MKTWFKVISIVVLVVAFVAMIVFPVYKTMQGFSLAVEISFIAAIIAAILLLIYASVRDDHSVRPKLAKWIMIIVILTMIFLFVMYLFDSNIYGRTSGTWWKVTETTSEQITESTPTPVPVTSSEPAKATTSTTIPATPVPEISDDEYIVVFRGATDQITVDFDNAWPGYFANDKNIKWYNSDGHAKIHMLGGTYTAPCDGILSGDVSINGVAIYDNNEDTFLVINVKKGDKITVNPLWEAWFSNQYDEDLIVAARQTAHPTWTRQDSPLN